MIPRTHAVVLPTKIGDVIAAGMGLIKRHDELGGVSPLAGLDLATAKSQIQECATIQARLKAIDEEAVSLTARREVLFGPVNDAVRAARDMLIGAHRRDPFKIAEYGFKVEEVVRTRSKRAVDPVEPSPSAGAAAPKTE